MPRRGDAKELRREHVERLYRTMLNAEAGIPTDEEALGAKLGILEDMINDEILIARAAGLKPRSKNGSQTPFRIWEPPIESEISS